MSQIEVMPFSYQLAVIYSEHVRLASAFLKQNHGLTYNEFVLLYLLFSYNNAVSPQVLVGQMFLSKRTILSLLDSLESKGFIHKLQDSQDKRKMHITLSESGTLLITKARVEVYVYLQGILWKSLPREEFQMLVGKSIVSSYNILKDDLPSASERTDPELGEVTFEIFPIHHYIFWLRVINQWAAIVSRSAGLSFYSFLVLLIAEEKGKICEREIADRLFINRSNVSRSVSKLAQQRLIRLVRDKQDERKRLIMLTKRGKEELERTNKVINEFTQAVHGSSTEEQLFAWKSWLPRMYHNRILFNSSEKLVVS